MSENVSKNLESHASGPQGVADIQRIQVLQASLDTSFKGLLLEQNSFRKRLEKLQRLLNQHKPVDRGLKQLTDDIQGAAKRHETRQANRPEIVFPEELPVAAHRDEISKAIQENPVVVISADTGSGKTTQIPKICLELGRGLKGIIGCTQPRRIAALTVAARVAEEMKQPRGHLIGHHVRFDKDFCRDTQIKFMTDGILLAETQNDPDLLAYDTLMIDEAHERSLNIDFLLGFVKKLLPRRPDLKIIVSSATLDADRFSNYFNNAPILNIEGKTYPVEVFYRPPEEEESEKGGDHEERFPTAAVIAQAVQKLTDIDPEGDILIFQPGEREIRESTKVLTGRNFAQTEILPLMARLPVHEQRRVFKTSSNRKVILATNVAETSVTIPGIRYVIDPGNARISRFHHHTQVQRLHVEPVSQASANQRKGRCGRTGPGICVRLYSEENFLSREAFTLPEIKRTSLAGVILNMFSLHLGAIESFPFIEPPAPAMISEGYRELVELGALDANRKLTPRGRQLARFPLEPRFARMLLEAQEQQALPQVLIIVAALSVDDARLRPLDKQGEADQLHERYRDETSDFITILNLWESYQEQARQLGSQNKIRRYCKKNFLSFRRIKEWEDVYRQLKIICEDLKLHMPRRAADPASIHRALLSGLLSRVGLMKEKKEYQGGRNLRFRIFPGSSVYKLAPKWVMGSEMVETSRLYARCVAKISPQWIEPIARHLCKYHYGQPFWDIKNGFVRAEERVTLYGLPIIEGRRRNYDAIDPVASREVFIRDGLVPGEFPPSVPAFLKKNLTLIKETHQLEHKQRRMNLLTDDDQLCAFYHDRLPPNICNAITLRRWLKEGGDEAQQSLLMEPKDVLLQEPDKNLKEQYPDIITLKNMTLPLSYHFDRAESSDGITCTAPVSMLPHLKAWGAEWLVPGALPEKLTFLLKSLPKTLRRPLVPIPQTVEECLKILRPEQKPLRESLSEVIFKLKGIRIPMSEWAAQYPDHLTMNFILTDEKKAHIAQGRNLGELEKTVSAELKKHQDAPTTHSNSSSHSSKEPWEKDHITQWDFGTWPKQLEVGKADWSIVHYPALQDNGDSVATKLFSDPAEARRIHQTGLSRLFALQCKSDLKRLYKGSGVPQSAELNYSFFGGKASQLGPAIADQAVCEAFQVNDHSQWPHDEKAFQAQLNKGKPKLRIMLQALIDQITEILFSAKSLDKELEATRKLSAPSAKDIDTQLRHLIGSDFPRTTSISQLKEYERYFQAIRLRIERLRNNPIKDQEKMRQITSLQERYLKLVNHPKPPHHIPEALDMYRWMLEEWRVSVFAQSLGTRISVSEKRLEKQWEKVLN